MKEKKLKNLGLRQGLQKGMTRGRNIIKKTEFKPENFQLEHVEVTITNLDPIFDDYCIVNISDIHLGQ